MDSTIKKNVFVIMPFTKTPTRNEEDLSSYFDNVLKKYIENYDFEGVQFVIKRSDDRFDITRNIILDVYSSDIVICDLSGEQSNPNVMYELGLRMALSPDPVILVREKHPENRRIFDVSTFFIYEYNPLQYNELQEYLIKKLKDFATNNDKFSNPVIDILKYEPSIVNRINKIDTYHRIMMGYSSVNGVRRIFASELVSYASERGDFKFSGDITSLNQEIIDQSENLQQVDWGEFKFDFKSSPPLDALLIQPPTPEMFPHLYLSFYKTFLIEFYNTFISTNSFWNDPTYYKILVFTSETHRLMDVLSIVSTFLTYEYTDKKYSKEQILEDFFETLKNSIFVHQIFEGFKKNNNG
jgi:hypothetical protein